MNTVYDKKQNILGEWNLKKRNGSVPVVEISLDHQKVTKENFVTIIDQIAESLSDRFPSIKETKKMKIDLIVNKNVESIEKNSFEPFKSKVDSILVKSPKIINKIETLRSSKVVKSDPAFLPPIPSSNQVLPRRDYKTPLRIKQSARQQQLRQQSNRGYGY